MRHPPVDHAPSPDGAKPHRNWPRALWVSLLLCLPALFSFRVADADDLNRRVAPWPSIDGAALLDPATGVDVAAALADRAAGRRPARALDARLSMLLGDDPAAGVLAGTDGWLFLDESVDLMTLEGLDAVRPRRAVLTVSEMVRARGRDVRYVVAPNKASLYPEHLAPHDRRRWQQLAAPLREGLRRRMERRPLPGWVDLAGPMEGAVAASPEPLYEPLGTHWVDAGALVAARVIVESLAQDLWSRAEVRSLGPVAVESDLLPVAGLTGVQDFEALEVVVDGVRTGETGGRWHRGGRIVSYASGPEGESGDGPAPQLLPTTLVFHDSFGPRLRPLLAPFFRRVHFVDYAAASAPVVAELLAESEVVVLEIAERYFHLCSGETPIHAWDVLEPLLAAVPPRAADVGPVEVAQ